MPATTAAPNAKTIAMSSFAFAASVGSRSFIATCAWSGRPRPGKSSNPRRHHLVAKRLEFLQPRSNDRVLRPWLEGEVRPPQGGIVRGTKCSTGCLSYRSVARWLNPAAASTRDGPSSDAREGDGPVLAASAGCRLGRVSTVSRGNAKVVADHGELVFGFRILETEARATVRTFSPPADLAVLRDAARFAPQQIELPADGADGQTIFCGHISSP